MITNEVQYHATKAHLNQFEEALANLRAKSSNCEPTKLEQLEIDAVESQAQDLREEIADYEQLRSGSVDTFEASSLGDLSILLIKARIARGWTQRQLADALGIAEQQVQRYEATDFRSASLARICDIADALGITVTEQAKLTNPDAA